ncbi:MAG: hypothetical protein L0027_14690 [Candidatus Rokubacteria bacterium]|nr:hypothetical protein [Candidatus Rokubacteria bacterium]
MPTRVRIEEVLAYLGVEDRNLLEALRREGLFEEDLLEGDAAEELRVATCLIRELGVNPAGVDVILHLRRRLLVLQQRMNETMRRLLDELEPAERGREE